MNVARGASDKVIPAVSIIIPCYNAEAVIGDAIESALDQKYPSVEVIVIDDGSTDASLKIIKSFGGHIRWETGSNRGGCEARNRGVELAEGGLIQFLDADDVLFADKLAKQVPIAYEDPLGIVYSDHQYVPEHKSYAEVRSQKVVEADPFVFVLRHRTLCIAGPIYKRDWLRAIGGFRPRLPCSQEFEMNLRLAAYLSRRGGYFIHLPEVLFEVRCRPGSVSSNTARTLAVKSQYLPPIVEDLFRRGELTPRRRYEMAAYAAAVGRQCIRGGKLDDGLSLVRFADSLDSKSADSRAWGPTSRLVKRLVGPLVAERLALWKRDLLNRRPA